MVIAVDELTRERYPGVSEEELLDERFQPPRLVREVQSRRLAALLAALQPAGKGRR
jgi:hypothetical protein